jgi:hypothetical protein
MKKAAINRDFGFASKGDTLQDAKQIGPYLHGWLRSRRKYKEFVLPFINCGALVDSEPEEVEYHARHKDPDTAKVQLQALGSAASKREARILDVMKKRGEIGATSKELSDLTGIPHVSTSTTMSKMVKKGLLSDSTIERGNAIVRVAVRRDPHQGALL